MNKKDLEFFKKILLEKKEAILSNIGKLAEEASNDGPADEGDLSVSEVNQYMSFEMKSRDRKALREIDLALKRIEDGTYGLCESCDIEISQARLKVFPTASLCIECKEDSERNREHI